MVNLQVLAAKLDRAIINWFILLYAVVRMLMYQCLFVECFTFLSHYSFDFNSAGERDSVDGSWIEGNGIRSEHDYHSSGNSNSSSISSLSSTSSDSDYPMAGGVCELEADADSLTCRQSGLSSSDQLPINGSKSVLHFVYVGKRTSNFFGIYFGLLPIQLSLSICLHCCLLVFIAYFGLLVFYDRKNLWMY